MSENQTFENLSIDSKFIQYLNEQKFTTPTKIQKKTIPVIFEGKDITAVAQTGTGKTLAFTVPMVQKLTQKPLSGLILVPTRELALQTKKTVSQLGTKPYGIRSAVVIGGESIHKQKVQLQRRPHMIIATPGRLIDHLERKNTDLSGIEIFTLDEADRMLDMGFRPQIEQIIKKLPKSNQTLLFSATMSKAVLKTFAPSMHKPVYIEAEKQGTAAENISQELFIINQDDKQELLFKLLEDRYTSSLVFTRTKYQAKKLSKALSKQGIKAAEIHSNRTFAQRKSAMQGFRERKYETLVATDIAARGIDVNDIELIVNYDLPDDHENYIHRIGRTARAGKKGRAVSFATAGQRNDVQKIEKLMNAKLPVSIHPEISPVEWSRGGGSKNRRPGFKKKNGFKSFGKKRKSYTTSSKRG